MSVTGADILRDFSLWFAEPAVQAIEKNRAELNKIEKELEELGL